MIRGIGHRYPHSLLEQDIELVTRESSLSTQGSVKRLKQKYSSNQFSKHTLRHSLKQLRTRYERGTGKESFFG
ncbi:unnamed protein product [Cuscuta campestris]|uniref:Uncharacterized protein n=1 Tax=Cuscuta campestris TaxID=132261 RepID=A0A484KN25_9ASTE|nr:unnamed protein product [Cuscuta campestris]